MARCSIAGPRITSGGYLAARLSETRGGAGLRLVPDRDLPAAQLLAIATDLRRAGAAEIWIVTERGSAVTRSGGGGGQRGGAGLRSVCMRAG